MFNCANGSKTNSPRESPARRKSPMAPAEAAPSDRPGTFLYVRVMQGTNLVICDRNGRSDPICKVWSARNPRNKFSTKVVKKNTNPVWHSKVFTFPRGESKLCLEVMDKDFYRTDCMGVAEVSLKDLQPGKPQAIWLPLENNGNVKMKYMPMGTTDLGSVLVHVGVGSTPTPPVDVFAPIGGEEVTSIFKQGIKGLKGQIDAAKHILQPEQMAERMAGLAKRGGALPTVGNDGDVNFLNGVSKYIYVKVLRARNLIPMDSNGLSDPFVRVATNDRQSQYQSTRTCSCTINPNFKPDGFMSFPFTKDSRHLILTMIDDDVVGNDLMGECRVDLTNLAAGRVFTEWYDLVPPQHKSCTELMTSYMSRPEKLGKVQVMVVSGMVPEPASELDLLPSFRLPLGRLKLQILQVEGVQGSDRPYFILHHEGKVEKTQQGRMRNGQASFEELNARWDYMVTELTGPYADIRILLMDYDTLTKDDLIGTVVIPVLSLVPTRGEEQTLWFDVLKFKGKHLKSRTRPTSPLGRMQVRVSLMMNEHFLNPRYSLVPYLANTTMPTEVPRTLKKRTDKASDTISNVLATTGRLVDALMSPLTGALAAILYLQQWRSLQLNMWVIAVILVTYLLLFDLFYWLWPLYMGAALLVQGRILSCIRVSDGAFLYKDEISHFMQQVEQVNTVKNNAAALYQKTLEEHKHKLATEQEEDGKEKLMGNVVDKVKSFVKLPKTFGARDIPGLSVYYATLTTVNTYTELVADYVSQVERVGNLINFKDPVLSHGVAPFWMLLWALLTVLWIAAVVLWKLLILVNPFTWTHLWLLLSTIAVAPIGSITQQIVATIDGLLLSLPIPLTPISWKSVDILTQRAISELQFKTSEEGKSAATKQVNAELQAIEALQVKKEKERAQFVADSEMKSLMRSSKGISTLIKKRLSTPLYTLGCLFNRIPSNREFIHRTLCMRTLRSDMALGEPFRWDCLPSEMIALEHPEARDNFCKALRQSTNIMDARANADAAAMLIRTRLIRPELRMSYYTNSPAGSSSHARPSR